MIERIITELFSNFGFVMFALAFVIAFTTFHKASSISLAENCLRWLALLAVGVNGIYNFIMHGFFGSYTAAIIGWQNSPFQYDVAIANLAFGLLGLFAFKATLGFRKAMVLGNACWLWGNAMGHIYQIITQHSFEPENTGSWFWLNILLPIALIVCVLQLTYQRKVTA